MPEYIRALIVIMVLASVFFAFVTKPACEIIPRSDFTRRRNLWLTITLVLFLAHNIWIYILLAGVLILLARTRESNLTALFFFILFVAPGFQVQVPGMGIVNYLIAFSHPRLLALVILLPAFLTLLNQERTLPFGRTMPDKILAAYLLLVIILFMRETTLTDTLRQATYQFIDVFLPYYVISRSLRDTKAFQDALLCFVIAAMILALIGSFESIKHWLLYNSLQNLLDIQDRLSSYRPRAGFLRATATVEAIPLGYVMTVSIGFFLYLRNFIQLQFYRIAGLILLIIGLLASLSRGPWTGAVLLFLIYIVTGPKSTRNLLKFTAFGLIALSIIAVLPGGEKIVELLPYFGSSGHESISYRERLLENSLIVISRHPFLGSVDYMSSPELEAMRQGQGIIDLVNTYLQISLKSGYIGLSLFLGFFLVICWSVYRSFRSHPAKNSEEYLLGRVLFATLFAILFIIFTVSSVSIVPIVYWSVAGLGVAYVEMMNRSRSSSSENDEKRYFATDY